MNGTYKKNEKEKEFLGQGIAFPFQLSPTGRLNLSSGEDDIQQSIRIILGTAPGERLMRPEFGCRIYELLFDPYDIATRSQIIDYVREALAWWEPRIEVQEVTVESENEEGRIFVKIDYTIKDTHDERSIIHPFYLMGEE